MYPHFFGDDPQALFTVMSITPPDLAVASCSGSRCEKENGKEPLSMQERSDPRRSGPRRGQTVSSLTDDDDDLAPLTPQPPPPPPPCDGGTAGHVAVSPTVHVKTLGVGNAPSATEGMARSSVAASPYDRDESESGTEAERGDGFSLATQHPALDHRGVPDGDGNRILPFDLPPVIPGSAAVGGHPPAVAKRATSSPSTSSALKPNPRFSPLVPFKTIRRAANKAMSRSGADEDGLAAGEGGPTGEVFEASHRGGGGVGGGSLMTMGLGLGFLAGASSPVGTSILSRKIVGSEAENYDGGSAGCPVPSSVASRLNLLLWATSKRAVPAAVRADRISRWQRAAELYQAASDNGETCPSETPVPTQLHMACANPDATLLQLQTELARSPASASVPDCLGRLPLHVLGDNTALVSTPAGKAAATMFALQLMKVYPEAITTSDRDGFFPFVSLINDWELWSYRPANKKARVAPNVLKPATRIFGRITDAVAQTGSDISNAVEKGFQAASTVLSETLADSSSAGRGGLGDDDGKSVSSRIAFPRIVLWKEVEWCFEMLSIEMDELGGKSGGLHPADRDQSSDDLNERDIDARLLLAKHLPTMVPSILKTILLIDSGGDEGSARKVILRSSLVRGMLLQPESVGDWITSMIRKRGIASQFAVDYLAMVSGTSVEDYVGAFRPILSIDREDFQSARSAVFTKIDELEGTVASLVTLGEKEIERAVSTTVIWYIMSQNLARPFVVSMTLIDFVLQIILLLAFRVKISDPDYGYSTGPDVPVPTNIVYLICWNYFLRKGCQLVALASVSGAVLRSNLLNVGSVTDILSVILVLVTYSYQEARPSSYRNGLNTFVLGLLWLRVLGFMKVVNKEMSTLIMALGQILRDLLYFMIVLVVVIVMFADMFRIAITTKDDGNFCTNYASTTPTGELDGALRDYCNPQFYYSVLRTYAVLIGDFSVDDFTATTGMIILFVIFTIIGVVMFLSVLIAVICDSYEVAKLSSHRLFGKARVSFVAHNEALESFLKPGSNPVVDFSASPTKIVATGFVLLRWSVFVTLIVTAMYAEVFMVTQAISSIVHRQAYLTVIFMTLLAVVLTCALWILVVFAVGGVARAMAPGFIGSVVRFLDRITGSFSKAMASRLFGLSKAERTPFPTGSHDEEEEWQGKMAHMEQVVSRTGNRIRDELKAEMLALEKRLHEHGKVVAAEKEASQASTVVHSEWDTFKIPELDHEGQEE